MSDVALHLSPAGISYALVPDPSVNDREPSIEAAFRPWPIWVFGKHQSPRESFERFLAFELLFDIAVGLAADMAVLTVEEGVDGRLVGACEIALLHADVAVVVRSPHPEGATGLARDWLDETIKAMPMPPMP